jgi:hypothetical protein
VFMARRILVLSGIAHSIASGHQAVHQCTSEHISAHQRIDRAHQSTIRGQPAYIRGQAEDIIFFALSLLPQAS